MDLFLQLLSAGAPYLMQFLHVSGTVKAALDVGLPIAEAILAGQHPSLPSIVPALERFGAQMFPKLAPALHIVAAAAVHFDPNTTKWIQSGLNALCVPPPSPLLVIDGQYGPLTKKAALAFQKQHGLDLTGFIGDLEQSIIQKALVK